jgi:hypothetical protein
LALARPLRPQQSCLTAFAAGTIVNPVTAQSQLMGGTGAYELFPCGQGSYSEIFFG